MEVGLARGPPRRTLYSPPGTLRITPHTKLRANGSNRWGRSFPSLEKTSMKWTRSQKNVVLAAYLGWTLDAFDFFLMVFLFTDVASEFHVDVKTSTTAVFLTLAARPIGAFIFGRLADRYGRKPVFMWNILSFSVFELASGFAP